MNEYGFEALTPEEEDEVDLFLDNCRSTFSLIEARYFTVCLIKLLQCVGPDSFISAVRILNEGWD